MHKYLIYLTVLTFSITYSQVQKEFFMDDVMYIEYVTVKFCVNNEAKINEVTIISDKTTYKNTSKIEELRQYLLGVEYYPDSQLKNNCYDSTFTFINSKYENQSLNKEDCDTCKKFLKGTYEYHHVLYTDVIIKRGKKIQKEMDENGKQIYDILWESNCSYTLIYKKMNEPRLKYLIGKEIYVDIIDILPDNSYVYRSTADFQDNAIYGIIKKID